MFATCTGANLKPLERGVQAAYEDHGHTINTNAQLVSCPLMFPGVSFAPSGRAPCLPASLPPCLPSGWGTSSGRSKQLSGRSSGSQAGPTGRSKQLSGRSSGSQGGPEGMPVAGAFQLMPVAGAFQLTPVAQGGADREYASGTVSSTNFTEEDLVPKRSQKKRLRPLQRLARGWPTQRPAGACSS